MPLDRQNASVSSLTKECISIFERCCSRKDDGYRNVLENSLADLRLWDDGVKATANGRSSLDWRFRERPDDLMLVKTILLILYGLLESYYTSTDDDQVTAEIFQSVRSSIRNLATIGTAIRRTGKASRQRRVESTFDPNEYTELRKHLECIILLRPSKAGLPTQLDSSNLSTVQKRLIEANLMRRHRTVIAHRRGRNVGQGLIAQETTRSTDSQPQQPNQDSSRSSELQRDGEPRLKTHDTPTVGGYSVASTAEGPLQYNPADKYKPGVAKTNITTTGMDTEFPLPPPNTTGRDICKCPCCSQPIGMELMTDSTRWRNHIIEDMCPYTCIVEDCPKPKLLFNTRKDWESHVQADHGSQWTCPFCVDAATPFIRETDMIQHLQSQHQDAVDKIELPTLLDGSSAPRMGISSCPLCSSYGREDSPEIINHILKHVYDFSLRALPWPTPAIQDLQLPVGTYMVPEDQFEASRLIGWIQGASSEPLKDPYPPTGEPKHPCEYIQYCSFDRADHKDEDLSSTTDMTHYVPLSEYFNIEAINDSKKPQRTLSEATVDPKTKAKFVANINRALQGTTMHMFFKGNPVFIEKFAEKAAALADDTEDSIYDGALFRKTAQITVHQQVLYCDDSTSMKRRDTNESRWDVQNVLINRIARVTTRILPESEGIYLRYINQDIPTDSLKSDEIPNIIQRLRPLGDTLIGTNLKQKVLEPLVYDKLPDKLKRPVLITVITDGGPSTDLEDRSTFAKSIVECGDKLEENGLPRQSVKFLIGQVGRAKIATEFLHELRSNSEIANVVFVATQGLDVGYLQCENSSDLDKWLIETLYGPIMQSEGWKD